MIDPLVKKNRWLLAAGLTLLIYSFIEMGDSLYVFPLQAGWIPDLYPTCIFPGIESLLTHNPMFLFPVFAFFATGRFLAAKGVLHNHLWGFWLGIFISTVTVIVAVFFLPMGGIDMLLSLFVVTALLLGFLGTKPMISEGTKGGC
jgi:hypothetical protein